MEATDTLTRLQAILADHEKGLGQYLNANRNILGRNVDRIDGELQGLTESHRGLASRVTRLFDSLEGEVRELKREVEVDRQAARDTLTKQKAAYAEIKKRLEALESGSAV